MNISINPSYFCNFSCDFCYLTPTQLKDKKSIDTRDLKSLLSQVGEISYIDLYGGEFSTMTKEYSENIISTVREFYKGEINIVTNLSVIREELLQEDISVSVSYDFYARERHEEVFSNMLMLQKEFSVLILASKEVIKMDVDEMIMQLNILSNLVSVEIKPYSSNQSNAHEVSHRDYEEFVIKWLESPIDKNFIFGNERQIMRALNKDYNAFSDDHVYITPGGKFGVLEFDSEDREFFLELDSFKDYEEWTDREKNNLSEICENCEYLGNCLTEHYRYVENLEESCNGYKGLLEYYERRN